MHGCQQKLCDYRYGRRNQEEMLLLHETALSVHVTRYRHNATSVSETEATGLDPYYLLELQMSFTRWQ
jgi:hypothetical protein